MSEVEKFGMGAMLHLLGGNRETVETFQAARGKQIASLVMNPDGDGQLEIRFTDGSGIAFYDDARSCCESRYMHTDDALADFVGGTLDGAKTVAGPNKESDYGDHEQTFLKVTTSKGVFTVVTHNEHNGYYGGIAIAVKPLPAV